jgi:DsbC/DsbD-like thiol-disulfide interchange protein
MKAFFLFLFVSVAITANAQIGDPTTWKYEVKKTGANQYELIFHLSLKDGWHIYAMEPGGDGSLIPPTFDFTPAGAVTLSGKPIEQGNKISKNIEGVGMVNLYNGKVDYVQTVTAKPGTKIKGTHSYQVCTDNMCLPPKTKPFTFVIKK